MEVSPLPAVLPPFVWLCGFLLFVLSTWGLLRLLEASPRRTFVGTICYMVRPFLLLHHAFVSRAIEITLLGIFGTAVQHLGECSSQRDGCQLLSIDGAAVTAGITAVLSLLHSRGGDWVRNAIGVTPDLLDEKAKKIKAAQEGPDAYTILTKIFEEGYASETEETCSESCEIKIETPHSGSISRSTRHQSARAATDLASQIAFNEVHVRVPAKVVLFGEHGVCYGKPAIAATVPLFLEIRAVAEEGLEQSVLVVQGREEILA